jgi:hypothetical protein
MVGFNHIDVVLVGILILTLYRIGGTNGTPPIFRVYGAGLQKFQDQRNAHAKSEPFARLKSPVREPLLWQSLAGCLKYVDLGTGSEILYSVLRMPVQQPGASSFARTQASMLVTATYPVKMKFRVRVG